MRIETLYIDFDYIPEREVGYKMIVWYDYLEQVLGDLYHLEENLDEVPRITLNKQIEWCS